MNNEPTINVAFVKSIYGYSMNVVTNVYSFHGCDTVGEHSKCTYTIIMEASIPINISTDVIFCFCISFICRFETYR